MNTCIKGLLAATALLGLSAQAAQQFDVEDGTLVQANVSANGMTRFAMKGGARIVSISGDTAFMDYEKDKTRGEIFIKPKTRFGTAFSFFVSDDTGATYTIFAKPFDMPGQVVFLNPVGKTLVKYMAPQKDLPRITATKILMRAMVGGLAEMDGYRIARTNNKVNLWDETEMKRVRLFSGYSMEGEVFTLKNTSADVLRVHESEFFGMHEHTAAVSVLDLELQPGAKTYVYVIHGI